MKTADSMINVQKADDYNFEYDEKMNELNQNMAMANAELNAKMQAMGRATDSAALDMASKSVASAAKWQVAGAVTSTVAQGGAYYKQGYFK